MRRAGLILLATVALSGPATAQGVAPPPPASAATTVNGQDLAFFQQLRQAIASNNQAWLSSVIAYPLRVQSGGRTVLIHNATEFQRSYAVIIDGTVRQAVVLQDADTLTKTLAGVSIGGGHIWFRIMVITANGMTAPRMLITAINN